MSYLDELEEKYHEPAQSKTKDEWFRMLERGARSAERHAVDLGLDGVADSERVEADRP